jgi:hypothetical protein
MPGSVLYRTDPETQELLSLLVRRAPLALMLSTDDLAQQPGWQRILSP